MINYYKIKKEWNNGKWDKTQKGAYTNKSEAINNCTAKLIEEVVPTLCLNDKKGRRRKK